MKRKISSKLTEPQKVLRAETIRNYGRKKFQDKLDMPRGTVYGILCGHRDSKKVECERQNAITGIPLSILAPHIFGPYDINEVLTLVKSHLVRKKTECTDDEWVDIGVTVKSWFI